jgi:putative DNA primase/helicase
MRVDQPIDFVGLAAALLARAHILVPQWLPTGIERNGRWYCGDFDGGEGESANVNLATGQWIDNGGTEDDRGGDLISLYARIHGLNNGQAARQLMEELGWELPRRSDTPRPTPAPGPAASDDGAGHARAADAAADAGAGARTKRRSMWRAITPVPPRTPKPDFVFKYHDRNQETWQDLLPARVWDYTFEGEHYGYVARFERIDSKGELQKEVMPRTWCVDESDGRGTMQWRWKQWEQPRPLYVPATLLSTDLSLPVVVVEGEKCAQAGHELLGHEFDFVSWPGGGKAWSFAHWSWLMGRTVYLWPDCDAQREGLTKAEREAGVDPATKPLKPPHKQPGLQSMMGIGSTLLADHGCTVHICQIPQPGKVPDGWDLADAIAQGWDAAKVREFIRAAAVFVPISDEARAKAGPTPSAAGAAPEGKADGWRARLITAQNKSIKPVRENAVLALDGMALPDGGWLPGAAEAAGVIAFNEFTNDVMKLKPTPWGTPAGVWDEVDELELGAWLTRVHLLPPMSRQTLEEAVTMVARRHRYHPARAHFEGLRGRWDGIPRAATWLARCCRSEGVLPDGDPLQEYLKRVGMWVPMAICARVLTPGCKFDYMLILEGGQGMGKSTLAQVLGLGWFADTGLVLGDKDSYQNLQGVLLYEWGELDSLTRSEVTKVKQFVSSQKDRFRASFDRRPKDYPRQVVFIGTTNESHYLSDPTGNRRFWPVRVTRPIDLEWLRANLDQLCAEALHYLALGARFHPNQKEQRELFDPQQLERTVENALESAIRKLLYDQDQKPGMSGRNWSLVDELTLADLLTALGISVDKQTQVLTKQASAALGRMGWERGRASGKGGTVRPWVYRRPPEIKEPPQAAPSGSPSTGSTPSQPTEGTEGECPF